MQRQIEHLIGRRAARPSWQSFAEAEHRAALVKDSGGRQHFVGRRSSVDD